MTRQPQIRGPDDEREQEERKCEESEEKIHSAGRITKPIGGANRLSHLPDSLVVAESCCYRRHVTRFDEQHTDIDQDQGQLDQRHQCAVYSLSKRLHGQMHREKGDTDQKGRNDASLLKLLSDQKHGAGERELPQHLEWLPPVDAAPIIGPQEGCRFTERGRSPCVQRFATRPQEQHVKHGDAHWPHADEADSDGTRGLVLVGLTIKAQILVQVSSRHVRIVLERVA
mmetsp:Transcript_63622/g.189647  ORF Transcript_63622/g.189647 Transcript_63622/m.189647 type:complete len:227 (+) Transcript_63622:503-1183(+)